MEHKLIFGAVIVALATAAGCTVNQTDVPALTGPSDYGASISITANPDTVALGQSGTTAGQQSLIIVTAFDSNGRPKSNQSVRLETLVNGTLSSCGQLALTTLTTGSDGRASTAFTAPGTPPDCPNFNDDGTVTIRATPVGTDFTASVFTASSVNVFMALPGTTAGGPFTVDFSISASPTALEPRRFLFSDTGSVSPGHAIVSYRWTWSDGATETGSIVDHDFASAGTYTVTLTVTDDIGQVSFKTALVTVTN